MRVFISADIEGTTFTTLWDETELGHGMYAAAAKQMTDVLYIRPYIVKDGSRFLGGVGDINKK